MQRRAANEHRYATLRYHVTFLQPVSSRCARCHVCDGALSRLDTALVGGEPVVAASVDGGL